MERILLLAAGTRLSYDWLVLQPSCDIIRDLTMTTSTAEPRLPLFFPRMDKMNSLMIIGQVSHDTTTISPSYGTKLANSLGWPPLIFPTATSSSNTRTESG